MSFAKQFLIYGIGSAVSRLAAILLVPLYTRSLSITEFGQLELLLGLYTLATLLVGLQSESALARDYFDAKAKGVAPRLAWGALLISLGGSVLLLLALLAFCALNWPPEDVAPFAPLLLAMAVSSQLLGIQFVLLRFASAAFLFAFLSFLDLALSALFSFGLVVVFDLGPAGALAGILAAKISCVLIAWPYAFTIRSGAKPSRRLVGRMLAYGVPAMPAVLLNWFQTNGSRVLLALFMTFRDLAVAGVAMKVAALYMIVVYSFRLAWEPYSFARLDAVRDDPDIFNRALHWYVLTMFLLTGCTMLVSPLLVSILAPPAYADALGLAGYFVMSQFWIGASAILSIGIHGARIPSRLNYVFGAGALVNLLLLALFVDLLGVTAAAVGAMAGAIVSAWLSYYFSERHFRTGFRLRLMIAASVTTAMFSVACQLAYTYLAGAGASLAGQLIAFAAMGGLAVLLAAVTVWVGFERGRVYEMKGELLSMLRPRVPGG